MFQANDSKSACVIGGGFYGVIIALYLKRIKKFELVQIYEREEILLSRASFANQARVHGGYHYPRSFVTAYRSRENIQRFCADWSPCVKTDFLKFYALARRNSKVTTLQFKRFCEQIGAPLELAENDILSLFNPALIESVYRVEEFAFDALKLRAWANAELSDSGIQCFCNHTVISARPDELSGIKVVTRDCSGAAHSSCHAFVFNCTYSGLSQIDTGENLAGLRLKHEISELALVDPPHNLEHVGITVMDGPFFSIMPFPAKGCHSLSHVRYTPHFHWLDSPGNCPYDFIDKINPETRVDRMIRDASRYLPSVAKSRYRESLFEVKTVLEKNESDDGRPILFRESPEVHGFYSVLGGKIDNVYDILEQIDQLPAFHC